MVEVIIALAVIAIALLQAVSLIIHNANMKEATREQMVAKESCSARMEEIKAKLSTAISDAEFTNFATAFVDTVGAPVEGLTWTAFLPSKKGRRTTTVDSTNPLLVEVVVRVEWEGVMKRTSYTQNMIFGR
jgi:Tfp pilus assembly protein PilV